MPDDTIGALGGVVYTPSDTAVIDRPPRGFQVAVAGDVVLGYKDGTTCLWPACAAGMLHAHYGYIRIMATGTTATGITVAY
jgi:hypothetical protein